MMEITRERLILNGWIVAPDGLLSKTIVPGLNLFASDDTERIYLETGVSNHLLPNVRTMEALSLLEHLLSDNPAYTIVDTAPIDAAIAAHHV